MGKKYSSVLLLVATAVCWSTSGILIKLVSLHPSAIAGWRGFVAGLFIMVACKKDIEFVWDRYTLAAAGCLGVFCLCFVWATKLSTAANAIVLQYSASAYVAVLAPWVLGEKTHLRDWITLIIVMAGVCLFFMDDLTMEGRWGICLGIFGAMLWAGNMLCLRKNKDSSTAWALSLGNFFTAILCLPFMFRQAPGLTDTLGVLGLGIISIGAGYAIFSYAIKSVPALEAILVCSIEPFINSLWVFLFLGELPGPSALIGGGLVLTAVTAHSIISAMSEPAGG